MLSAKQIRKTKTRQVQFWSYGIYRKLKRITVWFFRFFALFSLIFHFYRTRWGLTRFEKEHVPEFNVQLPQFNIQWLHAPACLSGACRAKSHGGHRPIWGSKFFFDSAPANASERSERSVSGCNLTGGPGGGSPLAGAWERSPQKNFENKVFKDSRKIDLQHTLPKNVELVKKTFILWLNWGKLNVLLHWMQ